MAATSASAPEQVDALRNRELASVDRRLTGARPPRESWDIGETPARGVKFLLLTPGAPQVIELHVWIDGQPLQRQLAELAERLLAQADVDGDGRVSWRQLTSLQQVRAGAWGNTPIPPGREAEFIGLYDTDRDAEVDLDELPRMLTRSSAGGRPFSIRSANFFLDINRLDSPARRLLDVDRNGSVDSAELQAAARRLRQRDADEDDILTLEELAAGRATPLPGPLDQRGRHAGRCGDTAGRLARVEPLGVCPAGAIWRRRVSGRLPSV